MTKVTQTITRKDHFNAAHALRGYEGLCGSIHGHNYDVDIAVTMEFDSAKMSYGMDISELGRFIDTYVCKVFDHKLILSDKGNAARIRQMFKTEENETLITILNALCINPDQVVWFGLEPTTENLCFYICKILFDLIGSALQEQDVKLQALRCILHETAKNGAELTMVWGGDDDEAV